MIMKGKQDKYLNLRTYCGWVSSVVLRKFPNLRHIIWYQIHGFSITIAPHHLVSEHKNRNI
jgi:hypothetical protein